MQSAPVSGQCQNSTEFQYETDQWPRGILAGYAIRVRAAALAGFQLANVFLAPGVREQLLGL